ncbi:MAG TPA: recombinase zinc beta ribbon domain-containing protein [Patescibacteria group bacterium]|nr:recombinase zinc beta ribbon domain-containing protein [Patescibacteria group bacterium]
MAHKKQHIKKNRLDFIFRGLMVCARCGCLYTASKKRGKHIYYYCTNGKNKCEEHKSYLKEDDAIKMLADVFERLTFPEEVINLMYEASLNKLRQEAINQKFLKTKNELPKQLRIREDRQAELFNLLLDKAISKDDFEAKRKTITDELNLLNEELKSLENKNQPIAKITLKQMKKVFLAQQAMKNKFLNSNPTKQKEIIKNMLWNAEVKDGKLTNIKFKEPYSLFAKDPQNGSLDLMWAE